MVFSVGAPSLLAQRIFSGSVACAEGCVSSAFPLCHVFSFPLFPLASLSPSFISLLFLPLPHVFSLPLFLVRFSFSLFILSSLSPSFFIPSVCLLSSFLSFWLLFHFFLLPYLLPSLLYLLSAPLLSSHFISFYINLFSFASIFFFLIFLFLSVFCFLSFACLLSFESLSWLLSFLLFLCLHSFFYGLSSPLSCHPLSSFTLFPLFFQTFPPFSLFPRFSFPFSASPFLLRLSVWPGFQGSGFPR